jgi:hypothetical protein
MFSKADKKTYREMVAAVFEGDDRIKERVDTRAQAAIVKMRETIPGATDDTLTAFAASVAYTMAVLLKTSVQDAGSAMESLFDNYTVAAAILGGAYTPGESVPNPGPLGDAAADFLEDDGLGGQYL